MDIKLSENLKRRRREKNISQQQLADYLQISFQSVSKWENDTTYPDITFLPKIASFLDITVDELLGVDKVKEEERIEEYSKESIKLKNIGLPADNLELWKKAYQEFPNNYDVKCSLMHAYFTVESNEYHERDDMIIELGKDLLENCKNNKFRDDAIQVLTYTFVNKKDYVKAEKYAKMADCLWCCSELLMRRVYQGEEKAKYEQQTILWLLDLMYQSVCSIVYNKSIERDYKYKYKLLESMLKIFDIIFEDVIYGFYSCRAYYLHADMAKFNILLNGDISKTLELLNNAKNDCIYFDTFKKFKYTSPMLNMVEDDPEDISRDFDTTLTAQMLDFLKFKEFDSLRDNNAFKAIIEELNKYPKSRSK